MFPEGNGKMRELLGGKGANLAEMTGLGMPVPQGLTITTEACTRYYEDGKTIYPIFRIRSCFTSISLKRLPANPSAIPGEAAARIRSLEIRIHARHDGYHPQPRHERRDLRSSCQADQ